MLLYNVYYKYTRVANQYLCTFCIFFKVLKYTQKLFAHHFKAAFEIQQMKKKHA